MVIQKVRPWTGDAVGGLRPQRVDRAAGSRNGFLLRRSGVSSLEEPGGDAQEGGCVSGEQ